MSMTPDLQPSDAADAAVGQPELPLSDAPVLAERPEVAHGDEVAAPDDEPAGSPAGPSFDDMRLSREVREALDDMGYFTPTPVQAAVYAPLAEGKDLLVQSRTGTGKTAAFGLPIIENLEPGRKQVQALILTPTRELALQVQRELQQLGKYKGVLVEPIYGGAPIGKQITNLRAGVHIVVGTPGRVLDHLGRRTLDLKQVKMFVLDECDEMLSMGFLEDIERVVAHLPKDGRQTLLFSATMPDEVSRFARRQMREPERIALSSDGISVAEIHHAYYIVSGIARTRDLLRVLIAEEPESAIIFCNTRDETAMVARFLQRQGLDAEPISSDLTQKDRERVMARTKAKNLRFLVATDVAARGIDISDLSHVINFTFPESAEVYVHRTGRTGRAGKAGTALSLIGPRELGSFYYLKVMYKIQPEERELPPATVLDGILKATTAHVGAPPPPDPLEILGAAVSGTPDEAQAAFARKLLAAPDGERIVAMLIAERLAAIANAKKEAAQAAERERAERERAERAERGDRWADRDERPRRDREDRYERAGRDRFDRGEDRPRRDREDRTERTERPERRDRFDRERTERPERVARVDVREDRPQDPERVERPERAERAERVDVREDRPRDRDRDDRPRDRDRDRGVRSEARDDRPRDRDRDQARADRPRDDRPRDRDRDTARADRPREDRPRDRDRAEARDDRAREDRPRDRDRAEARGDRAREDRPRDRDRAEARDDRPRDRDRVEARDDRPSEGDRVEARDDRPRDRDRSEARDDRPRDRDERRDSRRDRDQDRDRPRDREPVEVAPEPPVDEAPAAAVAPPVADKPARGRRSKNGVVAAPPPDTNRDFWETWADDRATRGPAPEDQRRDDPPADAAGDDAPPRAAREARPARERPAREDRPARGRREPRERDRGRARDEAPARPARAATEEPGSLVRLYVSLGKEAGVTADDVRGLLGRDLGDDAQRIGSVAIRATHCYVRVPEDLVDRIVDAVSGTSYQDQEIKVELARA
jgi:superfamily II DNA/RNA helicase